jgi:hypothetical protein
MPLFSKKPVQKLILMLDVQSSVIRGSLVIFGTGEPRIVFTYNASIPFKPHTDSRYLIKMTLRAVSETITAIARSMHLNAHGDQPNIWPRRISAVHYVLSSPWIVSQAKTLAMKFDKDTRITRQYILKEIGIERAKLSTAPDEPVSVIEEKIFDVRLNGYSVSEWENKAARQFEVSFTTSIAGTRMIERFVEYCEAIARPRAVHFHSSLLLQCVGMAEIMPDKSDYTLIHIHGELTDVAVIRHHTCAFFGSYPIGVRTLIRRIAATTGTDEHAAESILTLHIAGQTDPAHTKANTASIAAVSGEWLAQLQALFKQSNLDVPPPVSIILSAWAHDDFFLMILKEAYARIRIELLSIDTVASQIAFEPRTERRRLTALCALAVKTMGVDK